MERCIIEGENPVRTDKGKVPDSARVAVSESGCLKVQPEKGGILHLRLNNGGRPIANKYCEGKMERTLKRESKELEIVEREAIGAGRGRQSGWSPERDKADCWASSVASPLSDCSTLAGLGWHETRRARIPSTSLQGGGKKR